MGFTVSQVTAKVNSMTIHAKGSYTLRQAAYDLKKLRAKGLIAKVARSRRYTVQPHSLRAIAALLVLREHVITPILAGVRSTPIGRRPTTWTAVDRHYEQLRMRMHLLFYEVGIAA